MNENINLCEILKDCPKGTTLYSPIYGYVKFDSIHIGDNFPINVRVTNTDGCESGTSFTIDGKPNVSFLSECMLFPDKNQHDWSKIKVKKLKFDPKTLKPFDKILTRNGDTWEADMYSHEISNVRKRLFMTMKYYACEYIIPYNDDTKHLVGTTIKETPEYYRYWDN